MKYFSYLLLTVWPESPLWSACVANMETLLELLVEKSSHSLWFVHLRNDLEFSAVEYVMITEE